MFVEASNAKVVPPSGVLQNGWRLLLFLTGDNTVIVCKLNVYNPNLIIHPLLFLLLLHRLYRPRGRQWFHPSSVHGSRPPVLHGWQPG